MYWNLPSVTISSLQRTTKPLTENEIVCVYKQSEPAFFSVKPERMKELLEASDKLDEIRDLLDNLHSSGRLIYSDYSQLHDMT